MNKQEAIEVLQDMSKDSFENDYTEMVHIDDIVETINKIDETQKVVVPKYVAEWIKSQKESFSDVSAIDMYDNLTLDNNGGHYHEVWLWVIDHHYDFIKAWHEGYTVEKEKLYFVEIPNPNSKDVYDYFLKKDSLTGKLVLFKCSANPHSYKVLWLTESEIKQDFERAFQFAKEVE